MRGIDHDSLLEVLDRSLEVLDKVVDKSDAVIGLNVTRVLLANLLENLNGLV